MGTGRHFLRWLRLLTDFPTLSLERLLLRVSGALPIWGSLTTAFERALSHKLFGSTKLSEVKRENLEVVINACDLRTGTAFRFGSGNSGGWRYGRIVGEVTVAKAVAASAAFPLLLPPLIENFQFEHRGERSRATVVLTDGGVFENLGVNALEPGRDAAVSINTYPSTHIISLNAGPGQLDGDATPFWWAGRVKQSFETVHRKVQDNTYSRLYHYVEAGQLSGFAMVYLGQQDERLPGKPADLVSRDGVRKYPTDFAPMAGTDLDALSKRGEQLTQVIIDRYLANLD